MPEYNIAVVGSGGVGKSALTILFCHGNFVEEYDPTIEDSYRKQVGIDGHALILNILDTAGQEEYAGMRDQWMGRQEGFIMVYSIIDQNTFLQTQDWNQMITRLFEKDEYPRVLFGNKVDLAAESGGNVEGSAPGETVTVGGVRIWGGRDVASEMPVHASRLYAMNVVALLGLITADGEAVADPADEVVDGCAVVLAGEIRKEAP